MDVTLIPFALRSADGELVDVTQVPRGRKSGCECPSCHTPLIARCGEVKAWHFAHATRSTYASTQGQCDYSFFVSVRLMSRQVIGSALTITLPSMTGMASIEDSYGRTRRRAYTVTEAQTVTIENAKVEVGFGEVMVDVLGTVGEVPFALYFKHEGRDVPHDLMSTAQVRGRCGVVVINLDPVLGMFAARRPGSQVSFLEELRQFITSDVRSKSWLYHPRIKAARLRAEAELKEALANDLQRGTVTPVATARIRYECVMCKIQWTNDARQRACPTCRSMLYVREIGTPQ